MTGYHGTTFDKAEIIVEDNEFKPSVSNPQRIHWLGDGVYFFQEEFFSFWWGANELKRLGLQSITHDLFKERWSILESQISADGERVFNLQDPITFYEFKAIQSDLISRAKSGGEFYKWIRENGFHNWKQFPDGVLLNFLFNECGFKDDFDMIVADFDGLNGAAGKVNYGACRVNQVQICVKRNECIDSIKAVFINENDFDRKSRALCSMHNRKYKYIEGEIVILH
ncbi:hypothetical protein SANA_25080 [Gottschalkiaceae bacterium SANA]|nr:hypothetical protein SANA_25080 [Gottschalkiaceae bacterium SANA]